MYKSTFLVEKNWGAFFIKLKCRCLRSGLGVFKNTKHLKFDKQQILTYL